MSYGPTGQPRQSQRGRKRLLVGLGVMLIVIAGGAALWLTQRGEAGSTAPATASPTGPTTAPATPSATVPNVARVGGTTTGQAKELSDALTAKGLDCTVRFTVTAGGNAGCFSWADRGRSSAEVLFQYQVDGTVTGLNLKTTSQKDGVSLATLATTLQAVAPVVFAADQDRVAQAVAGLGTTDDTTFDGTWGKYQVRDGWGGGSTVSAAKSGVALLSIPRIEMTTTPTTLADGLAAKGMTCHPTGQACDGTFRDGKGRTSVLDSGVGSGGIMLITIGADDTSRDSDARATKQAFTDLLSTTFGIARGKGLSDVQTWVSAHRDGQSHSAYVGGWRVDLVVKYGTLYGAPDLASNYRLMVRGDSRWAVPS